MYHVCSPIRLHESNYCYILIDSRFDKLIDKTELFRKLTIYHNGARLNEH